MVTLWLGLYRYAKFRKIRYFFGVTSLRRNTSSENMKNIYCFLKKHKKISRKFNAKPLVPVQDLTSNKYVVSKKEFKNLASKMTKNYLKVGAYFIGEPTYDNIFQVYDLLTIFDITTLKVKSVNSILTLKNYLETIFSKS